MGTDMETTPGPTPQSRSHAFPGRKACSGQRPWRAVVVLAMRLEPDLDLEVRKKGLDQGLVLLVEAGVVQPDAKRQRVA